MPPDKRWYRFARADESVLRRAQGTALARFVREELAPFSRHYGALFERESFDPRRGAAPADLRALPPTEPRELLRAQGLEAHKSDFLLRPTPAKIKDAWSFSRKLAIGLGGERAREQLVRTYAPCFRTRERVADDWLFVDHTRFDLEVLGEHGAREKRLQLGALKLCLLVGTGITTDDKRRAADALSALGATDPVVCRAFTLGLARALFVEPPADVDADPGFVVSPDLNYFELVRPGTAEPAGDDEGGELLLSSVSARGTAVLRYRTGLVVGSPIDWTRCKWSGMGLARIASDLAPIR